MQRLEVSGAVRPTYGSLGVKRLTWLLALTTHLLEVSGQTHAPAAFLRVKKNRYKLIKMLRGLRRRSEPFKEGNLSMFLLLSRRLPIQCTDCFWPVDLGDAWRKSKHSDKIFYKMLVVERFLLRPSSKFNQVIMLVIDSVFPSLICSQFLFVHFMIQSDYIF